MKPKSIIKTVKLKITSHTTIFDDTLNIYNEALSFLIDVVNKEWEDLIDLNSNEKVNFTEKLINSTPKNPNPKYPEFNKRFYKFPSYLRRACISEAIGVVSSHKSRYENWLEKREEKLSNGKKFYEKPPKLQLNHKAFPVFYKSNVFKKLSDNQAQIKIYRDNDWKWIRIDFNSKNLKNRDLDNFKELNPSLVKKGKKYFLHIPFEKAKKLNKVPLKEQITIGVDLGLTNSAVCCAIKSDGTVIGRDFINQPIEKDRLKTKINKLSKAKRLSGVVNKKPNYWRKINNLNNHIAQDTANKIVEFAIKHNATHIVFEHLGKMRTPKGFYGAKKLRFKLQFWAKSKIQQLTTQKAHINQIRISRVLARGTSKYAYDGSGEVKRNSKKDIATFKNGKKYHCDLSASYNIASRYFIRDISKTLPEKVRLDCEAKVPHFSDRANHTLFTLIKLQEVVSPANKTSVSRISNKEAPSIADLSA